MKSLFVKWRLVLFLLIGVNANVFAQTPPVYIADSLQAILENSITSAFTHPGAIMTVTVPGEWTWSGSSGYAISGQTSGQPQSVADTSMQFRIGSITKNMVAACILKLEQDGLLNINDPINNYLRSTLITDTIQASLPVTIRHLLNHTSGIANSADNTTCQMDVLTNPLGSHSYEEAVFCGASQGEIFPPGFAWAYSNTNYTLLAMIIEEVSGQTYSDYLNQTIIQPLNLQHTLIPANPQITSPHMGCYWFLGSNPWTDLTVIHPSTYTGWADVVSTTKDLITYYTALRNGQIINSTELAVMNTIDPASYDYGMGLDFYTIAGEPYVGHYGEVANTSALFFGDIHSAIAPNGYYITYNFNIQGVDMQTKIDVPVFQFLNSGVASVSESKELECELYPNPATENIQLNFESGIFTRVKIIGVDGSVLHTEQIQPGLSEKKLSLQAFSKGVYFIQLENDEIRKTMRFVKI